MKPRLSRMAYATSSPTVPRSPVSSAMAEKMKSECATGTRLGLPSPGPRPKTPPLAIESRDWTIWYDLPARIVPGIDPGFKAGMDDFHK